MRRYRCVRWFATVAVLGMDMVGCQRLSELRDLRQSIADVAGVSSIGVHLDDITSSLTVSVFDSTIANASCDAQFRLTTRILDVVTKQYRDLADLHYLHVGFVLPDGPAFSRVFSVQEPSNGKLPVGCPSA